MIFTWLVGAVIAGMLIGAFFDEICNWAKGVFERLSSSVKKGWTYLKRVPGGVKAFIRYVKNGTIYESGEDHEVSWEDVVAAYNRGEIDDDTYEELEKNHLKKVGELNR